MATGCPDASVIDIVSVSSAMRLNRTRNALAPTACSATSDQANGNSVRSSPVMSSPTPSACIAASSRAGWIPNRAASAWACSGSDTSAKTSSPRRHIRFRPWNTGP